MKIKRISTTADVEISFDEFIVLNAALNEVCNGIDVSEFETRIGAPRETVEKLMVEIQAVLERLEKE
ncbi:hypothetical protein LGM46_01200 [Burkholderia arboris]|uniref:hypothetical protein n=1 Tax=Burkholderia arboris TaxID=488730 RepID=UPI001CF3DC5C|nr:hypothetical protein [Burkholderia arboris]MCA8031586.1 hypothetical protein [Burkholderia arboris]